MAQKLYPFKFKPILKDKIWGGTKLKETLKKPTTSDMAGESWEISTVDGNVSEIINGPLQGNNLQTVIENYPKQLLGSKIYERFGKSFPLLIKFIDAKRDLSIQLHPNDSVAQKRHNSFGKTEMWYVLQADEDARLIVGFNQDMNRQKYLTHVASKTLPEVLNFDKVCEGDSYFIEAGRIHAIGGGVMLAEIQQTSDITYRVYDWDRKDVNGKYRELHNDLAIDSINFELDDNFRIKYQKIQNNANPMVSCSYFKTNYLELTKRLEKKNRHDSFLIYICVEGSVVIEYENTYESLSMGETILIPASLKTFYIQSKFAKLLEVYI